MLQLLMTHFFRQKAVLRMAVSVLAGLLVILVLLLVCGEASAASYGPESGSGLRLGDDLQQEMMILEDPEGGMSIQEAADPAMAARYVPYLTSGFAGTQTDSVYWVRLDLFNDAAEVKEVLLVLAKPHLSNVTMYQYNEAGALIRSVKTGRSLPFEAREYRHRNFVFHLKLGQDAGQRLYFQVRTDSYLQLPMTLQTPTSFYEFEQRANLLFGMYYGVMIVMALYNLFLYLSIKDRSYLYYVLFIVSFAVTQAVWDGLAYQYLWPGSPAWERMSNPVCTLLTILFACAFSQKFLSVPKYAPRLGKVIYAFIALLLLSLAVMGWMPAKEATQLAVYLASAGIVFCMVSIAAVRFRDRSVYFYTGAWIVLFAGTFLNLLAAYKLFPLNFWSLYSVRIGSVAETILLSLALADRFNSIRHEKQVEQKQAALLKRLHETTRKMTATHELEPLLRDTLNSLSEVTGCGQGLIWLEGGQGEQRVVQIGELDHKRWQALIVDTDSFVQRAMGTQTLQWAMADEELHVTRGLKAKTGIAIPIGYHDRPLGVIVLFSFQLRRFSEQEGEIFVDFAHQVGISIENARLFAETKRLASTDGLSGVFNRTQVLKEAMRQLSQCRNMGQSLSLIMVDIDHFKSINDRFGHLAGDRVIQETARRLTDVLTPNGLIGRYGGEEFVVVLPGVPEEEASRLAEQLRRQVAAVPFTLNNQRLDCTISLGVSSMTDEVNSVTGLIDQADQALYRAKESGRNCVKRYQAVQ